MSVQKHWLLGGWYTTNKPCQYRKHWLLGGWYTINKPLKITGKSTKKKGKKRGIFFWKKCGKPTPEKRGGNRLRMRVPRVQHYQHFCTTKKKARECTSGQKASLGRILRNFRLRMRITYFGHVTSGHVTSGCSPLLQRKYGFVTYSCQTTGWMIYD